MDYELHEEFIKIMHRLSTKDPNLYNAVHNKIEEIKSSEFIEHYKNLRAPLQEYKRAHITKRFVLLFKVDNQKNKIIFRYFEHRDKIYKKSYD